MNLKDLKQTMKKLKKSSDNLKDSPTSTRWKSINFCLKSIMKEEKLWQTKKELAEEFEAQKNKRKNCKPEFKVKLKEAIIMKPC